MMNSLLHKEITEPVLKIFYDVYNELGFGFLEKVYQNAMYLELKNNGFDVIAQQPIKVHFKQQVVGEFYADLLVNGKVILELKATDFMVYDYEVQLLNYLRSTDKEVGLLLNFGKKPEFKRLIYTNERKKIIPYNL